MEWLLWHGIGYGLVVIAYWPMRVLVSYAWSGAFSRAAMPEMPARKRFKDLSTFVGLLERLLFLAALLTDQGAFIGLWIGIKVAGGWRHWTEGYSVELSDSRIAEIDGRTLFNIHLIGNGLNVLVVAAVAQAILFGIAGRPGLAVGLLAVFALFLLLLGRYLKRWASESPGS